jgi:glycosyltransferase involved in cell wall biosynthesis
VLDSSSRVIAISQDIKTRTREDLRCGTEVEVIHYGLTSPEFQPTSRNELGLPEDEVILISVGRLIKRKAIGDVLLALSRLEGVPLRLLIIGDGPEEGPLRDLASTLGLASQVDFLGAVWGENKFQYLAASDMLVLPSVHEGFGLVFLEAMHCGLPVIASDSGGQTDFLQDGETGFLVPVGAIEALAHRIQCLANDGRLRKRISEHNAQYVKRFNISAVAERYEALFADVIGRSRTAAGGSHLDTSASPARGNHGS